MAIRTDYWSPEEDNLLAGNYEKLSANALLPLFPYRTKIAIYQRAQLKLGLVKLRGKRSHEKVCTVCGAVFSHFQSAARETCSFKCGRKSATLKLTKPLQKAACKTCSQIFYLSAVMRCRSNQNHFCSKNCRSNWNKKILSSPQNPRWSKISVKCFRCGTVSLKSASQIRKTNFCSLKCNRLAFTENSKKQIGILHPRWAQMDIPCKHCGTVFRKCKSYKKVFCCNKCKLSYKGETAIERIVKEYLQLQQTEFERNKKIGRYFVDFFIRPKFIIECDGGYWHSKPEVKIRDKKKDMLCRLFGYEVLRLPEKVILKHPEIWAPQIMEFLYENHNRN